ncbi:hypothetical protein [Moraxella oblonga]|uniref:hypothetical protein n=1 Tax=Moraxella oblonga TaxID=200413 RepID=UPI00083447DF|nr:hypothetical protein [Moraxella oblonga]
MLTFTATEAKQNFGRLTDVSMTQPVSITRQGRVILEVMTLHEKERIIEERVKELMFAQFVAKAVQANEHYQSTKLHTTHHEMRAWVEFLVANPNEKPPVCHK